MNDPHSWAVAYLAARGENALWRWADDGNVIVWADGTTICFREEIITILEWLVPQGWPSFGALVWLLAACRGKVPPMPDERAPAALPGVSKVTEKDSSGGPRPNVLTQNEVCRGLAEIARLPADLRGSPKAKAVLAEVVFGKTNAGERAPYGAVLEILRAGTLTDDMLNAPALPPFAEDEWQQLHGRVKGIDAALLGLRIRTGLDAMPKAAEIPLPPAARVRGMIEEMRNDPNHAGLSRLTRDFMAALQMPRRLSERDDLPLGGVADIANRGNLDRLLLSELAHDDLMLAVRIAIGEALYLRREPPAKQPPGTLGILIDCGVRVWGIPRVLSTAVALAMIAKSADRDELTIYRARGSTLAPADLLHKEGLTSHLGALEPQAHPGEALAAFREALKDRPRAEAVLITQRDVIKDPEFRRYLKEAEFADLYLAVVDRDGSFELFRYPDSMHTSLCHAHVDLGELLPPPKPLAFPQPLLDPNEKLELPLIFSLPAFPLRIAVRGKVQKVAAAKEGGICMLGDGRLLKWDRPDHGAWTVARDLPRGHALLLKERTDGSICAAKADNERKRLSCRVFAANGSLLHSHDWHFESPVRRVEVHHEALLVFHKSEVCVLDLHSGMQLVTKEIPGPLSRARYAWCGGKWLYLRWDGARVHVETMTAPQRVLNTPILSVFERDDLPGPSIVTMAGEIFSPEGERVFQLGKIHSYMAVSDDGMRLLFRPAGTGTPAFVDLKALKVHLREHSTEKNWRRRFNQPEFPTKTLHTSFSAVALEYRGFGLWLYSNKSGWWRLCNLSEKHIYLLQRRPPPNVVNLARPFADMRTRAKLGFDLKIARWSSGRCVWLDGRGMLHMRHPDSSIPELTVTLVDGPISAWSSDGECCGTEFFVGDAPQAADQSKLREQLRALIPPFK